MTVGAHSSRDPQPCLTRANGEVAAISFLLAKASSLRVLPYSITTSSATRWITSGFGTPHHELGAT